MSAGPGWIGPSAVLLNYLAVVGADKAPDGKYLIGGEGIFSFLGMGEEIVVPTEAVYFVGGKPVPLAASMVATMGSGPGRGLGVTVIS